MSSEPILRLELLDIHGHPIKEKVDILLRHQVLTESFKVSRAATKTIDIKGLRGAPQGRYRLEIDPPSYQYAGRFVNLSASGVTALQLRFAIDPFKVKNVRFPAYSALSADLKTLLEASDKVLAFANQTGKALYESLDDIRRAGLLNIGVKTAMTSLANGRNVLSYIRNLTELRGDRFFAVVSQELREETKNSLDEGLFHEVDSSLHHAPSGYSHARSFKTPERYGNLQLTFFSNGADWVADIDIDDAGGLEHVFQVVRNKLSGRPTHPYNIHQILVGHQQLDPGYEFLI